MNDLKTYSFSAWDWDDLVSAYFPKWFHSFIEEALAEYGVMVVHAGVLLEGRKVMNILDDARLLFAESKDHTRQLEDILKSIIDKIESTYRLYDINTRVIVRT